MFQDAIRFIWGPAPLQLGNLYMVYGRVAVGGVAFPAYNLLVIAASLVIAGGIGWFLSYTNTGRILRATAEDRETAQALGVDVGRMYALVFTLGTALGTLGGALVAPASAASLDMPVELVVEAFAVVVIGGLGSMRGALAGALIVGLMRAGAIAIYPEAEILAIYVVVLLVLVSRPAGLFGRAAA
jgi:branched-chain amino acid transport system permease protein